MTLSLLAMLATGPLAWAAPPRDELLRLVPKDAAFCFVVQDLRGHLADLVASPFAARFASSPLGKALADAPELKKLKEAEQFLAKQFGVTPARLRDDLFGDAVVLAYRAGPPGQPELEQGLVLTWTRDPKLAAHLVERLNELQLKSGDVTEVKQKEYRGQKYARRINKRGGIECFWQRGPILVLATRDEALEHLIDQDATAPPADANAPPIARGLADLGVADAFAVWWINPRAFDAELARKVADAQGPASVFLRTFANYWKHLDGATLYVRLDHELELGAAVRLRTEGLSEPAKRFLTTANQASALWTAFPPDPLLAIAGRIDLSALVESVGEFLTPEAREAARQAATKGIGPAVGRDRLRALLAALGPDVGLVLTAPKPADVAWWPRGLVAVRVHGGPAADQAMLNALEFFVMLAAYSYNGTHEDQMRLERQTQDGIELRVLVNDKGFPSGFRPAFALKDGYLVAANHPDLIRRFRVPTPSPTVSGSSEVPWLRVSLRQWHSYLADRRKLLAKLIATNHSVSVEEADREVEKLLMVLALLDRLELSHHAQAGSVRVTVRVRTIAPLK